MKRFSFLAGATLPLGFIVAGLMISCGGTGSNRNPGSGSSSTSTGSATTSGSAAAVTGCDKLILSGGSTRISSSGGTAQFTPTGSMNQPRAGHTATLLSDGRVLVIDGGQLDINNLLVPIVAAEIFDSSQGRFSVVGSPCVAREFHTASLLPNGKVLIAGGNRFSGYPTYLAATATSELFDPATLSFTTTGSMEIGRTQHTSTLLSDGRVLIVGGSTTDLSDVMDPKSPPLSSTEIYDSATGSFTSAANMNSARYAHTATLLKSGKVLIAGGENNQNALASAELYDPKTNTFSVTGAMTTPRSGHTATLLSDGEVLIIGGASNVSFASGTVLKASLLSSAELYDPATGMFTATGNMTAIRIVHTATLLPNGKVLVTGGFKGYGNSAGYESLDSAEIYDPATATFSTTYPMTTTRLWHTATELQDGSILVTGGVGSDLAQTSAEIFR